SLHNVGQLLSDLGRRDEALAVYRQALTIGRQLVRKYPKNADYRTSLASTWHSLALLYQHEGKNDEAQRAHSRARDILENLVRERWEVRHELANTLTDLADVLKEIGKREEALRLMRRAAQIREELLRKEPRRSAYQQGLARTLMNLATLLFKVG